MEIKAKKKEKTLTDREKLLIKYIASGYNDAEISDKISVSIVHIRQLVSKILSKSDTNNRPQLVYWAVSKGMID